MILWKVGESWEGRCVGKDYCEESDCVHIFRLV